MYLRALIEWLILGPRKNVISLPLFLEWNLTRTLSVPWTLFISVNMKNSKQSLNSLSQKLLSIQYISIATNWDSLNLYGMLKNKEKMYELDVNFQKKKKKKKTASRPNYLALLWFFPFAKLPGILKAHEISWNEHVLKCKSCSPCVKGRERCVSMAWKRRRDWKRAADWHWNIVGGWDWR